MGVKNITDFVLFSGTFERSASTPLKLDAFQDIFLTSQVEYTIVHHMTKEIVDRLNLLRGKEEKLRDTIFNNL